MITVHKFELPTVAVEIEIDPDFIPRLVGLQNDIPRLWAQVNTDVPKEPCHIRFVGTGHSIDPTFIFAGSFQHGPFVWHMFYKTRTQFHS